MLQRFPVIVGPTAGGKSAVAVAVALELRRRGIQPAEILSADSMQVFRGLDIGTAKAPLASRGGVAHHLIDLVEPTDAFSVDRWLELAEGLIDDLRQRAGVPIVAGGTHFYIKALLEGLFEGPAGDEPLRRQLRTQSAADLRQELERIDPVAAQRIHPNDQRRTIRAIEVFRLTGKPITEHQSQWDRGACRPDVLLVGLVWSAETLNRRINERVRDMVEQGLVEETRALWEAGRLGPIAHQALGYRQLVEHFDADRRGASTPTIEDAIERIKIETRRFAKQQRTWLRRLTPTPGSLWIEADGIPLEQMANLTVERLIGPADGHRKR